MQLSLNWLKDFIDIPKSLSPEELGLKLTLHTVEVDSVEKQADKFANIVVGRILEIKKHPNADRLQIAAVETRRGASLQIVCGAANIAAGQLVPVALAGAILPNGAEIKEAEVRGEKSYGMLCAEDELGLGEDHSGIMILDNRAKIGQNLAEYLELKDVIYDIDNKSLTNRPDLWSHYGMAREIAAFLDVKLKKYNVNPLINVNQRIANMRINVKVDDSELCPRYMAIAMSGIKIGPSPEWMRERLIAAGSRPINNIVDVANYVMLELGQPLHAFDLSKISGAQILNPKSQIPNPKQIQNPKFQNDVKIVVRRAKRGEVLETLDGEKRELDGEMLVIADKNKPLAIAGVMGGANSEVDGATTEIILESANFNFISIRKTSQKLGLRTESSIRFEKSLDPNLCEQAMAKAVELIKKICPEAKISGKPVDAKNFKLNQGPIKLDLDWLNKIIGQEIEEKKVVKILNSLGFKVEKEKSKTLSATIPSWRAGKDISIKEDLVEEIARIYGYHNLTPAMPSIAMKAPEINEERVFERRVKNILTFGAALAEVYNYSFVGEEQLAKLGADCAPYVKLANPIAAHQTMLRQSLAPNLIENIRTNQDRFERIRLFEIGSICLSAPGEINKDNKTGENLPYQEKRLGIILAADEKIDVFSQAKGIVEYLLASLDLPLIFQTTEIKPNWADESACAKINASKRHIGLVAKLNSKTRRGLGLKKEVAMAEISFAELFNIIKGSRELGIKKFRAYDKYPPAIRDLAFVVNEKILYNDIRDEIISFSELIKKVELFDVYRGGKLGKGKKNLAFHIAYLAPDRTLTSEEVDGLQKRLVNRLEEKFEAKIRDF